MAYQVPFVDPRKHYRSLKTQIDAAIIDCLSRGDLIYRRQLRDFEEHLAAFVGTKYAIGVGSGYQAIELALRALGIGPGDEVITVAHTFVATISAIVNVGAKPVLVDVAEDFNMNPEAFAAAISPRTRVVIPVSLNGRVCQMDRIQEIAERYGLAVIEDAAQALGAEFGGKRAGSFGLAGIASFYPFKILGGIGDGGAVTTNDPEIARAVRLLRYNGEDRETGDYHFHGSSSLLDNLDAAVLDVKLGFLPQWLAHRREIASLYRQGLGDIPELRLPHFDETHQCDAFQNYVIRAQERDSLRRHLKISGVETLIHWPKPIWEHAGLKLANLGLPRTEAICREVISLPMNAEISHEQVEIVIEAIRSFFLPVRIRATRAGNA